MRSDIIHQTEFSALAAERDPELRAEGLLHLASRHTNQGREDLAVEIYQSLGDSNSPHYFEPTAARAERRLRALNGGGDFGERFEVFGRRFFSQATDPALLIAMGIAGGLGAALRFGALARLTAAPASVFTRGLGARFLASAGALAFEAPGFTAATRLGRRVFGHEGVEAPWQSELLSGYVMLGALRLSTGAVNPWLNGGSIPGWNASLMRQGSQLGGLLLAHRAEVFAGLRPEMTASQALAESLGTLLHFHVSGRLSASLMGSRFAAWNQGLEIRSRAWGALASTRPSIAVSPEPAWVVAGPSLAAIHGEGEVSRGPLVLQMTALTKDGSAPAGGGRRPMASGDFSVQEEPSIIRLSVENLIRHSDPQFFEPELMEHQISQKRGMAESELREVEQGIRLYLNEEGIPSYPLHHEKVQAYLGRPWLNSRTPETPFSAEALAALAEIQAAQVFLRDFRFSDGHRFEPSPFLRSEGLSQVLGRDFYYLSDIGRPTGSFKERGALIEVRRAALNGALHVVTASHGNHGLAVAMAAQKLGLRSTIVVPDTTPQVKIDRLHSFNATVVVTGEQPWRGYEEARDWALRYVFERNLHMRNRLDLDGVTRYIHGFEDVIPGQGVAAYEMLAGLRGIVDPTFLVPTGGGGLAAGLVTVIKSEMPRARVIGVLSEEAPAMHLSLIDGVRSEVFLNEKGLCDSGIGLTVPGARPFRLLSELLDGTIPVSDPLVGEAMRLIHRHEGLRVEGGAATGLASVLGGRLQEFGIPPESPLVTIFTGGNVDLARHGDVMTGREAPLPGGILDR
jgi:threonine dehydratase